MAESRSVLPILIDLNRANVTIGFVHDRREGDA